MAYLIDTSLLGRLANSSDVSHSTAVFALAKLHRQGEELFITPQNLIEFRNFATRPVKLNGLGLSPKVADSLQAPFESSFSLLDETPAIFQGWKTLVAALGVVGKQVHDARLVAVCHVYGVEKVVTFNVAHFLRFTGVGPGIKVINPANI